VCNEIKASYGKESHWWFAASPDPIGIRSYNLRSDADLEEQRFLVTIRLLDAGSRSFVDVDLAIGAQGHQPLCAVIHR
jgi:hypothetical protein